MGSAQMTVMCGLSNMRQRNMRYMCIFIFYAHRDCVIMHISASVTVNRSTARGGKFKWRRDTLWGKEEL